MIDFFYFAAGTMMLSFTAWIIYALRQAIKEDRENES